MNWCQKVFLATTLLFFVGMSEASTNKRVPAEWEPQAAMWLQWPGQYERSYEPAFAKMAAVMVRYQLLNIVYGSGSIERRAREALKAEGVDPDHKNLEWHHIATDSAWMRDNGPVYVVDNSELRIQNWAFDAWGGAFGTDIPYARDNKVPSHVGKILDMPVDEIDIVHERGNLEFNGVDTVIANWSTLGDPARNPGYRREQAEKDFRQHFGVERVVFIEGIPEGDLTRGHIDGIARFINTSTVVVPQCTKNSLCQPGDGRDSKVYDDAARTIEAAGFTVLRDPIEGYVSYRGSRFDTDYMNWIVGNGFVIAVGFGNPQYDQAAQKRIESYFPGRDVYVIEMLDSWISGGGAHCHTNDQPAASTINATL
ncbi:MAG: agmatine deiminase family protein [Pseudomonadota bacterium]